MTKSRLGFRELRFELRDSLHESLVISEMRPWRRTFSYDTVLTNLVTVASSVVGIIKTKDFKCPFLSAAFFDISYLAGLLMYLNRTWYRYLAIGNTHIRLIPAYRNSGPINLEIWISNSYTWPSSGSKNKSQKWHLCLLPDDGHVCQPKHFGIPFIFYIDIHTYKGKGKGLPQQAWTGPRSSG